MPIDAGLLGVLTQVQKETPLKYTLHLNDKQYGLDDVTVVNSPAPVNSPTTRGGVYFSDKFYYKVKGIVRDLTVVPLLSKTMLGPNTSFHEIKITAQTNLAGKNQTILLFTNLINSVQSPSQIELHMILVRLESVSLT